MSKLNLNALKERAEATASNELLATISGGTENSCHTNIYPNPNWGYSGGHSKMKVE